MGWLTPEEQREAFQKFHVQCEYMCDGCEKPIFVSELPYIDPKGGYYPKPPGTPDFLPKHPRKTYHRDCDRERRGIKPRKPKEVGDLKTIGDEIMRPGKEKAKEKEREKEAAKTQKTAKAAKADKADKVVDAHASKKLSRIADKVMTTIRAKPKKKWTVWEIITVLKSDEKMKDIRAACNYLKAKGSLKKKQGALHPTTKP